MDWQAALRARLVADNAVAALVATRVYWVERPQASAFPAITLQTVSDARNQILSGFDSVQPARVQIDVWAETYAKARQITEAVLAAVVPSHTGNGVAFQRAMVEVGPRDLSERLENKSIFRTSMDLIFHHATA